MSSDTDDPALDALPDELAATIRTHVVNERRRRNEPELFDTVTYTGRNFAGRVDQGFGNPIRPRSDSDSDRARCIIDYWHWLQGSTRTAASVRRRIRAGELDGTLSCWCETGPCHAWVLTGLAHGHVDAIRTWIAELDTAHPAP